MGNAYDVTSDFDNKHIGNKPVICATLSFEYSDKPGKDTFNPLKLMSLVFMCFFISIIK